MFSIILTPIMTILLITIVTLSIVNNIIAVLLIRKILSKQKKSKV